jgi:hypothetical protein
VLTGFRAKLTLVAMVAVGAISSPAYANDPVDLEYTRGGAGGADVVLNPSDPGSPGGSADGADPAPDDSRTPGERTCTYLDHEIDCTSDQGVWSESRQCFVQRMPGTVSEDSPFQGHTDGAVFRCATPGSAGGGMLGVGPGSSYLFWAPSSGPGTPVLVDPVTLAEEAVERMALAAPRIGMTPLRADAPLLVGMDAWLWVDNAGPRGFGPIERTATAGATSVTARAEVTRVDWDLGDGTHLTCRGPGTPWTPERGTGRSPTCGHRYTRASTTQPDATFTVRATTHWVVHWTGAGQSGRITFSLTGVRAVEVTELQVLQTG